MNQWYFHDRSIVKLVQRIEQNSSHRMRFIEIFFRYSNLSGGRFQEGKTTSLLIGILKQNLLYSRIFPGENTKIYSS